MQQRGVTVILNFTSGSVLPIVVPQEKQVYFISNQYPGLYHVGAIIGIRGLHFR